MPFFSTLSSILPDFKSFTEPAMSVVTVPLFGFGINPLGPRTLPSLPSSGIISGVATILSTSSQPDLSFSRNSLPT